MAKIRKTPHFVRMEEKYLKKLSPEQRETYFRNVETFELGSDGLRRLDPHRLSGNLKGFHSFTCLRDRFRNDRIRFEIVSESDWPTVVYEEIDEALFHLVGSHDEVY